MNARLLNEKEAKEYLGGVNPRRVMEPLRLGGRVRWDIKALDEVLNRLSGLCEEEEDDAEDAFDDWERNSVSQRDP